jgi:hypothetical protein
MSRQWSWLLAAGLLVAPACGKKEAPLTPEQARAKGDALIKKMSDAVAAGKTFSYTANESRERVRRNGEKYQDRATRNVVVRRPNALTFTASGGDHDGAAWYDGTSITVVLNKQKVWARGPMPETLDEALDYLAVEYAMQLPTADLLYSNPYEALLSDATTGGWVNVEPVDGVACDHLSYQEGDVAWELWLRQDTTLPKKIALTYKSQPGQPRSEVVFSDLNTSPAIADSTFTAVVPEGYSRIKIMRHASVEATPIADAASTPPTK